MGKVTITLYKLLLPLIGVCAGLHATTLFEGFDNVGTLAGAGWVITNNSSPIGTTSWFQGNPGVFTANSGATNSYIAANFDNAADTGGDISDWLITPELTMNNGDLLSFFTGSENAGFADRLQVWLSSSGASTNVGATSTSTGDFTTLLLDINPTLNPAGYPAPWTQEQLTLALGGVTDGRLAFRYFVGDTTTNGDYIGIDDVSLSSAVPEPATSALLLLSLAAFGMASRRARRNQA